MVLTVLEGTVAPERAGDLERAYQSAGGELPPGLIRTELVRATSDPARWRIQTLWASREALDAMRQVGTPVGVLMFRAAGAEPVLTVYEVVASLSAQG